ITRIQDEAHRFAIEYHRSLRSKAQVKSSLDDIPGVGPSRRRALMKHFRSIEDMRNASVQEIAEVPGIPTNVAIKIKEYLDKK
ncbi:MAG: excinuclease ABC subunit C, partial [Lachnospiraceae bacterium]|nr:excinuclease ABC subunit C [Lachnospiraceae bacterium]